MPVISHNDIARAIYLSTKDKGGTSQIDKVHDITKFLARRRLLGKKKEILASLEKIVNKHDGIAAAKIKTAEKLSHKTKEELEHLIKKRYAAKEVRLSEEIDESLLGGIRIEVNDEVIDLSIKNKIIQLQEYLTQSA